MKPVLFRVWFHTTLKIRWAIFLYIYMGDGVYIYLYTCVYRFIRCWRRLQGISDSVCKALSAQGHARCCNDLQNDTVRTQLHLRLWAAVFGLGCRLPDLSCGLSWGIFGLGLPVFRLGCRFWEPSAHFLRHLRPWAACFGVGLPAFGPHLHWYFLAAEALRCRFFGWAASF